MSFAQYVSLLAITIGTLISTPLRADDLKEATVTLQHVIALLEENHLSNRPVDDAMSKKWFALFIHELDPRKMYFLQADIDRLAKDQANLDDLARAGEWGFVLDVHETFHTRLQEGTALGLEELERPHDFTVDESIELQFSGYAQSPAELRERWRKSMKLRLLQDRLEEIPHEVTIRRIKRWIADRRMSTYSTSEISTLFIDSLARAYDPQSRYFSRESIRELMIRNSG